MRLGCTDGGGSARALGQHTGVNATLLYARAVVGAVVVDKTLNADAFHIGISTHARRTTTASGVVIGGANSTDSARVGDVARVHTLVTVTDLVVVTIRIHFALHCEVKIKHVELIAYLM